MGRADVGAGLRLRANRRGEHRGQFHEHFADELKRWKQYEFAQIPLDAQTGEMKIITTGDEATFAVPEMTTWEDVQ